MADVAFTNTPPTQATWGVAPSPVGPLLLGQTAQGRVCRLTILGKRTPPAALKEWQQEWHLTTFEKGLRVAPTLSERTPVLLVGSDFQHRVWAALLDIPAGETVTYGDLARRIGRPRAARAVGTALGANPVPFLVPCHRVVACNGLGGFTGGLALKKRLLAHEGHCA